jgi:response regulator RpfG family c-di-GMP phosphodiesterase
MTDRIRFVDDEPSVLDGYKRTLHREFDVDTAEGAEQGLNSIRERGPYAVVISDMRMPGMNGAEFLSQVRQRTPESVRMLLTGYTDLDAAMHAVNEGNIFRFLTKPCDKEVLIDAITAGLVQYRLVTAEKELLEKTLMGSIKVLTEVLSAASPEAFGRSMRITRYVRHLVAKFSLPSPWRFEAAAMLSQLGYVTLEPELIKKSFVSERLSPEERARLVAHPKAACNFLANIPRLDTVAWMISQQLTPETIKGNLSAPAHLEEEIALGAKILRLAVALDSFRMKGLSEGAAIDKLRDLRGEFSPELIDALADIEPETARMELRKVSTSNLTAGMILQQEIRTRTGMLVVPEGHEITQALLIKLDNFSRAGTIDKEVMALIPV